MEVLVLGAKSAVAALLLVAGGAKLADLASFASAVRLFAPRRASWAVLRAAALGIALAELALGAASLSSPAAAWPNRVAFAAGCAFVAVSGVGYAFHRGRSCRCFGALSQRKFDAAGIARSAVVAVVAAAAMAPVQPSSVQLTAAARLALLGAAALLAFVAFTAARALAVSRESRPGRAQPGGASQ
jgi:methylamine utilization protein MauE